MSLTCSTVVIYIRYVVCFVNKVEDESEKQVSLFYTY